MRTRTIMLETSWEADEARLYAGRALLDALRRGEAPVSCVAMWSALSREHRVPAVASYEIARQLDAWVFYIDVVDEQLLASFAEALRWWGANVPQALRDRAIEFRSFGRAQTAELLDPALVMRTRSAFGLELFNFSGPLARAWGVPGA
jgi:hypothetical protein